MERQPSAVISDKSCYNCKVIVKKKGIGRG